MTAIRRSPRTPEDCDDLLAEYLAGADLDAIVTLYEPTACFVSMAREVIVGHAAIRDSFRDLAAGKPTLRSTIILHARNGEDLVLLYNDWTMEFGGPDGKPVQIDGKAIETVRRQSDGTWRFAIDDPWGRA